jgi:hypothetical protein
LDIDEPVSLAIAFVSINSSKLVDLLPNDARCC